MLFAPATIDLDPRDVVHDPKEKARILPSVNAQLRKHVLAAVLSAWREFEASGSTVEVCHANAVAIAAWRLICGDVVAGRPVREVLDGPGFASPSFAIEPVVRALIRYRDECAQARRVAEQLDEVLGLA